MLRVADVASLHATSVQPFRSSTMSSVRTLVSFGLCAAIAAGLSGCGGSDDDAAETAVPTGASAQVGEVEITTPISAPPPAPAPAAAPTEPRSTTPAPAPPSPPSVAAAPTAPPHNNVPGHTPATPAAVPTRLAPVDNGSAGCGESSPVGEVIGLTTKDGNGSTRHFDLSITPSYNRNKPSAVVFNFHALGGRSAQARRQGFTEAIADTDAQGIVVLPQGVRYQNYGIGWAESCTGYDMAFFDAMLKYVSDRYCVDKSRVFVTGFSWGADMAHAVACCRGDNVKSIAPFSGSDQLNSKCSTMKWPAVRFRWGTLDGSYSQNSFNRAAEFYRDAQGCSANANDAADSCVSLRGCNRPVVECRMEGLGHSPPTEAEVKATWKFWQSLR